MATLEEAWELVTREGSVHGCCLLDLRRRVETLEARAAAEESSATEPAQEWIERRIYKKSIEYSEYIKQRFQDRTSLSFVFDGHRWQYRCSSFDDAGDYDVISRPSAPEPAPAPAADRPLWEVMQKAYSWASGYQEGFAAEIDAVAEWLDARGCAGSAYLLRAEARRAREGA